MFEHSLPEIYLLTPLHHLTEHKLHIFSLHKKFAGLLTSTKHENIELKTLNLQACLTTSAFLAQQKDARGKFSFNYKMVVSSNKKNLSGHDVWTFLRCGKNLLGH